MVILSDQVEWVKGEGNYLYFLTTDFEDEKIQIWDVSDPDDPFKTGEFNFEENEDVDFGRGDIAIDVDRDRLYHFAGFNGINSFDISDKSNPTFIDNGNPIDDENRYAAGYIGNDALIAWKRDTGQVEVYDVSVSDNPGDWNVGIITAEYHHADVAVVDRSEGLIYFESNGLYGEPSNMTAYSADLDYSSQPIPIHIGPITPPPEIAHAAAQGKHWEDGIGYIVQPFNQSLTIYNMDF